MSAMSNDPTNPQAAKILTQTVPNANQKWWVLAGFSLVLGVNQLLWLTFAAIVKSTEAHFGVNEFLANLLTLIFPIVYVLCSIHAGHVLDKQGYLPIVRRFAVVMLVGSVIRWLGASSYWVVFVGQLLIALAQPYLTNAINQITGDWFETAQINTATGLIIGGVYIGTAIGAFLSPPLVDSIGFSGMLLINALITLLAVGIMFMTLKANPKPVHSHHLDETLDSRTILTLLKSKYLWFIAMIIFLAMGYFNGLTNWLAPLIAPRGFSEIQAGNITASLIVGGIFGAMLIPMLSDKLKKRRIFILLAACVGMLLTYPLMISQSYIGSLLISAVLGFFLLSGYPLLIAAAEQLSHGSQAAKAVALLMLMGNLGGVTVVVLMEAVKGMTGHWDSAGYLLMGVLMVATMLAFIFKDLPYPPSKH